jgi:RNA polymerase sigma-70 factor, ECF subfamily
MIPTTSDPDELLERARGGDAAARETILASQRDRLRRMVAVGLDRRLASRVDPSDVVQEAMADAARGLPQYLNNPPLPFFPWLRQFARERLAKLHRHHIKAGKRSVAREEVRASWTANGSGGVTAQPLPASGTSPSGRLIREESRQRVWDAMARLSEADRQVLTMRDIDGFSVAQIASALGASEGAIKVRHLRALRRLRTLLEGPP